MDVFILFIQNIQVKAAHLNFHEVILRIITVNILVREIEATIIISLTCDEAQCNILHAH